MSNNDPGNDVKSPYRRFINSHRRAQASMNIPKNTTSNLTGREHPQYHRNGAVAIEKAHAINKEITKNGHNDTPSPTKFTKATIFDSEKADVKARGYRDSHKDNPNKIINNNTMFRIFNQIKPRDPTVPPLENLNLNPNKWKPKMTYYYQENKGEITQLPESKTYEGYMNPNSPSSDRERRLQNSKRHLNNYLEMVNTDPRLMNTRYRDKLTSKSAMTKLPIHDTNVYAVPEMARHGPTNKTIAEFHKKELKDTNSSAFGVKRSMPVHPIVDMQRKKIIEKETNLDALRSRRYQTIDHEEKNYGMRRNNNHSLLNPKNPRPKILEQKLTSLEVDGRYDRPGGITYRDHNAKSVYPINQKGNVKKQITSVFERNDNVMKNKYPQIAPVFRPAEPRTIDIENNPLKKLDTTNYFGSPARHNQIPMLPRHRPEFMDVLSMSKKLDSSVRIGK